MKPNVRQQCIYTVYYEQPYSLGMILTVSFKDDTKFQLRTRQDLHSRLQFYFIASVLAPKESIGINNDVDLLSFYRRPSKYFCY